MPSEAVEVDVEGTKSWLCDGWQSRHTGIHLTSTGEEVYRKLKVR